MSALCGPRQRPRIVYDEEGSLTIWTGKHCSHEDCGIQLTSRNRYGEKLLCLDHGRQSERERARRRSRSPRLSNSTKRVMDPERKKVHDALSSWLSFPDEQPAADRLRSALVDHELKHRLRHLLPQDSPSALTSIPVEEPTFTNPKHRSTRLEFLADCDAYGV